MIESGRPVAQVEIAVLSTTALKTVFEALSPQFERATGMRLAVTLGPSLRLEARLAAGETTDVAILAAAGADEMVTQGKLVAGTLAPVAKSSLGVAVQRGLPRPDLSSVEGFRRALLTAKSVAVSKPVGGGQSGVHMAKVFEQLGIADAMHAKAIYGEGGPAGLVGLILLRGDAEIGVQQIAELMSVEGIDFVGPLPAELQAVTTFTAGLATSALHPDAAKTLIEFLRTPAARSVIARKGLDPA